MRHGLFLVCVTVLAAYGTIASGKTVQVGPGRTYTTVAAGYGAASAGDTIEIDAGTYTQSAGWINISKSNLTIRGVSGGARPILDAASGALSSKGIFVISSSGGNNLTVENLEFRNAWINNTLGANAAGIRFDSASGLTVRNCRFYNCQDGILGGGGTILIEYTEFDHCGEDDPANTNGYGYTHNMYLNGSTLTLQYCWSHDSNEGHIVKSRVATNYILYNLLSSENNTSSRELQIANGGTAYIIGNVIIQGPNSDNSEIVTYGDETSISPGVNPNPYFYMVNNTVINQRSSATFVTISTTTNTCLLENNIFQGSGTLVGGAYASQAVKTTNWITTNAGLANIANHDYHLTAASTGAINLGTAPGTGYNSVSLTPVYQYVHPCSKETRPIVGTIDIGAYEYYIAGNNTAPTVNAGIDQTITLPTSSVSLSGSASDDGLPSGTLTYTWSQVSGPATVSFTAPNAASTTATGLTVAGSYVLQLTVSDGVLSGSDAMTVTVNPKPNSPPTVNAGADVTMVYENQGVTLHATASDADNDPLTYSWSQVAGMSAASSTGTATASFSFIVPSLQNRNAGVMTFSVTVNDGRGGIASDSVSVLQVYMAGDISHDWYVNVGDLQLLVAAWGTDNSGAWGNWNVNADLNGDGFVNVSDLQTMVASWGRSLP